MKRVAGGQWSIFFVAFDDSIHHSPERFAMWPQKKGKMRTGTDILYNFRTDESDASRMYRCSNKNSDIRRVTYASLIHNS